LQLSSQGQEKAGFTAVIDWRAFLVSLADAHFDYCISASTLDDIVLARTDFFLVVATKKIGHPTEGWMTLDDFLKTKVWFDKSKSSSTHAQYVTLQQYFSHPRLVIYFFTTSPIKLKLGLQKVADY
jgi:hypothetical protein